MCNSIVQVSAAGRRKIAHTVQAGPIIFLVCRLFANGVFGCLHNPLLNMKPKLYCIAFAIMICMHLHAQKNLVVNSGFEDELNGWNSYGPIITPWVVKSGKKSFAIVTYTKESWTGADQIIFIPKKTDSLLKSAWAKAENIEPGKDAWNTGLLNIQFLDASDKNAGEGMALFNISGSTDWAFFEKRIAVPVTAKKIKIMLAMSYCSGSLFADDIACTVIQK